MEQVKDLRKEVIDYIETADEKTDVMVTFLTEKGNNDNNRKRIPGGLKGKVSLPDNFNDPIDDLKDYM